MALGSSGSIDGLAQIQLADDARRRQIAGLAQQLGHGLVGDLTGAVAIHPDGDRLRHTDGIGQLHLDLLGQAGSHQILGHIAGHIGSAAVHLGGVLAGEGAAAVGEIAAVGIHNDLPPGQAGVAVGTADDKMAGGIDEDIGNGVYIKAVLSKNRGNNILPDISPQSIHLEVCAVHNGDNHGVHANNLAILIELHSDLGLAIGPQQVILVGALGEPVAQGAAQGSRQRHQLRGLGAGTAEHHALVTGTAHLIVGTQSNVCGLGVDAALDLHGVGIETVPLPGVTDGTDGFPGNGIIVHLGLGGDLTADQAEVGGDHGLAGHAGAGVLSQAGIQNGIGNGVGNLVGVAIGNTFRGKESFFHVCFPFFFASQIRPDKEKPHTEDSMRVAV